MGSRLPAFPYTMTPLPLAFPQDPVASKAAMTCHHRDGCNTSIRIDVRSWRTATAVTANDVPVKATHDGVALTFAIEPGASYIVRPAAGRP